MNDGIRRVKTKTQDFTVMLNDVFRRDDLSARAKGVYAYLMTLPDDWKISQTELFKHFTEGRDALRAAFGELIALGYITSSRIRGDGGKILGVEWTVWETPKAAETADNQDTGFQSAGKPTLLNTEELNTERKEISLLTERDKESRGILIERNPVLAQAPMRNPAKVKWGEYRNVLMTEDEGIKLVTAYGRDQALAAIEYLSAYREMKGYKAKSDYLAIRKWVFTAMAEDKQKAARAGLVTAPQTQALLEEF